LSEGPHAEEASFLDVGEEHDLTGIEHTEISSSVDNDTNDRDTESSIKSDHSITFKYFL